MSDCVVTLVWFEVVLMLCCNLCCDLCITCCCLCTMLTTTVPIWTLLRRKQRTVKTCLCYVCFVSVYLCSSCFPPNNTCSYQDCLRHQKILPPDGGKQPVLKAVNHKSSFTPPKTSYVVFVACEYIQLNIYPVVFFLTYSTTIAFFWPFLQPSDRAAWRHYGRISGLKFDSVTPQWPASLELWNHNGRQISPNVCSMTPYCLVGDVCIVLIRDCTPECRTVRLEYTLIP